MIIYTINTDKESNNSKNTIFNNYKNSVPKNTTDKNNNILVRYCQQNFNQDLDKTLLYDSNISKNNDSKYIISDLTATAIRNFKYNIALNTFDDGYPQTSRYILCDQKLATVFAISTNNYISINQTVDNGYPYSKAVSVAKNVSACASLDAFLNKEVVLYADYYNTITEAYEAQCDGTKCIGLLAYFRQPTYDTNNDSYNESSRLLGISFNSPNYNDPIDINQVPIFLNIFHNNEIIVSITYQNHYIGTLIVVKHPVIENHLSILLPSLNTDIQY